MSASIVDAKPLYSSYLAHILTFMFEEAPLSSPSALNETVVLMNALSDSPEYKERTENTAK